jgi:hypothetical protein
VLPTEVRIRCSATSSASGLTGKAERAARLFVGQQQRIQPDIVAEDRQRVGGGQWVS